MPTTAEFWNKAAPRYAKSKIADEDAYRATLTRTLSYLTARDRVLELGCGTASTALEIAPHVAQITATDISSAMIEIGRARVSETSLDNITLRVAEADDPALAQDGPFDAVLALNVLHLVDDPKLTLSAAHRLLKPGGLLITKTACLGDSWYFRPLVTAMQWVGKAPHVVHLKASDLRAAIEAAGFDPVEELLQSGAASRLYHVARRGEGGFDSAGAPA